MQLSKVFKINNIQSHAHAAIMLLNLHEKKEKLESTLTERASLTKNGLQRMFGQFDEYEPCT